MKAFSVYNLKMNSLINILSPSIISNHVWSMVYSKESTHCTVYSTLAVWSFLEVKILYFSPLWLKQSYIIAMKALIPSKYMFQEMQDLFDEIVLPTLFKNKSVSLYHHNFLSILLSIYQYVIKRLHLIFLHLINTK